MVNFYKVEMVLEARNRDEAETLIAEIISDNLWMKEMREMTDDEIYNFFGQTKEDIEKEDNE